MGKNLASKFSKKIDERFTRASQASLALNNDYEFTGVKTVNVYSIPTVPMGDYNRGTEFGKSRYGTPNDLQRNVQSLTVSRDRGFTFVIDKGDKLQSEMVMDAGKALSRQVNEVWIPEYDAYVFRTLAYAAQQRGNCSKVAITKSNAYEHFLNGMEVLGNKNVPDTGRVCFASYRYANFLKQDPAFMRYGDTSQDMLIKGVIGEVDGCKIVKVPSSRLPAGCAFLITHPCAATAPKQLEEYKTHDNPPGISGWLVEGRVIYDCFVLDEKVDAIYYHGSQDVLKSLDILTAPSATSSSQTVVLINTEAEDGHAFKYKTYANVEAIPADLTEEFPNSSTSNAIRSGQAISVTSGHTVVVIVEVDGTGKILGVARTKINVA